MSGKLQRARKLGLREANSANARQMAALWPTSRIARRIAAKAAAKAKVKKK